jgi:uncharacterized tellurite resistance protein B-like protein
MNTTNATNDQTKKKNIEYFIHLIRISISDGTINLSETKLLNELGKELGLTADEIRNLTESTRKSDYMPPFELAKRFEQVYNIVKMALADGMINKNEMKLASNFAEKSGFKESEIPKLLVLLIGGIKEGKGLEFLYKEFKKENKAVEITAHLI